MNAARAATPRGRVHEERVASQALRWARFPLANRYTAYILSAVLAAIIVWGAREVPTDVPVGLLLFIPLMLVTAHLKPPEIVLVSWVFTILSEQSSPFHRPGDSISRAVTTFVAFLASGLLAREIGRNRKATEAHSTALAQEMQLREISEQQIRGMVEGSPAPILTLDAEGKVLMANEAAHQLLRCPSRSLLGQSIDPYLPALADLRETTRARQVIRTLIECTGKRVGGEAFLGQVWVSSYGPPEAVGMSVVVFDSSEQLRSREEVSLEALATGARVMMGAFWHEVRNLCAAMRMAVTSLQKNKAMADTEEVNALHTLLKGLERLSASGLKPDSFPHADVASLRAVLDHMQIVVEPWFRDSQMAVYWPDSIDLPLIRADHYGLLQVCLNLARNAHRALQDSERKEFRLTAAVEKGKVLLTFFNTGSSIPEPETLFQPFQPRAGGAGLGLYVSRAIVRSFGGDLSFMPESEGCCFSVRLEQAEVPFIQHGRRDAAEDSHPAA